MKQSIFIKKTTFRAVLGSLLLSVGPSIFVGTADAATIAWWRFEDPANTGFASEANPEIMGATQGSGSSHAPNVAGPYILDGTTGEVYSNSKSVFHGAGSGASLVNSAGTSLLNDVFVNDRQSWTFEAIINKPTTANYATIFGNGNNAAQGMLFNLGANGLTFTLLSNGRTYAGTAIPMDEWVHLAVVANPTGTNTWDVNMYVNYELKTTASSVILTTLTDGYRIGGSANPMVGRLDELRISDAALTTEQMLRVQAIPEPSMVALVFLGGLLFAYRHRNLFPIGG